MSTFLFERRHMNPIAQTLAVSINLEDAKTQIAALFRRHNPRFNSDKYWECVKAPSHRIPTTELGAALVLLFDGKSRDECVHAVFAALPER